jgi:hypothetical protein
MTWALVSWAPAEHDGLHHRLKSRVFLWWVVACFGLTSLSESPNNRETQHTLSQEAES